MTANNSLMKQPSAWLPLAMSALALAIVVGHVAMFGSAREADEGAAAHLWQALMVMQIPLVGFFVLKRLPRNPKQGVLVLTLQAGAIVAALAPVFVLGL